MELFITVIIVYIYTILISIIFIKNVINNIVLSGLFSVLTVVFYILMKAPDVAITEAAIGSALSTLIFILTMLYIGDEEDYKKQESRLDFRIVGLIYAVGGLLILTIYTVFKLPTFGNPNNISHMQIANQYLNRTSLDFGFENIVTAILGGYRGFDTLLETSVIMMAAFGVKKILKEK
jgi:multicomponent Na+:H+ antiporter subunit B